jgi:hypothetical protein
MENPNIMPMTMTIPEVLRRIMREAKSKEDTVRLLRENSSHSLKQVLYYAFLDKGKWYRKDLPKYTPESAPDGLTHTNLFQESKRLYIFKEVYKLPSERKDQLLIQILESVHSSEAEVIKELFDGTFGRAYSLDKKVVLEAFPDLSNTVLSS